MNTDQLLKQWYAGIRVAHILHRLTASHYSKLHRTLGVIVVFTTTLVGTALFATLTSSKNIYIQSGIGCISVAAAVLSTLQTFLGYAELSEKHKAIAVKYGELRRELDQVLATPQPEDSTLNDFMTSFRTRWNSIDQDAPSVPDKIYAKAQGITSNVTGNAIDKANDEDG